jgi:hypothetical protein
MAKTSFSGPLIVFGNEATPPGAAPRSANQNPDAGPSLFYAGVGILDPRPPYTFFPGQAAGSQSVLGWLCPDVIALEYQPSAVATNNIAASQTVTSGLAMTLAGASAGIVLNDTIRNAITFATVTGLMRVDQKPSFISFGATVDAWDPTTLGARAVSITATGTSLAAVTFVVRGYDIYGYPLTENITGPAAGTANGKKAFKWVASITPSATPGTTAAVGTSDVFGFPVAVSMFPYTTSFWNNIASVVAQFVAADATTPSAVTGDVRGTQAAVTTTSDGTRKFVSLITVPVANIGSITGMFGLTPF